MNRAQVIRDTLTRLLDTIHAAEDIDRDGGLTYDASEVSAAVREAERVLAQEEEV